MKRKTNSTEPIGRQLFLCSDSGLPENNPPKSVVILGSQKMAKCLSVAILDSQKTQKYFNVVILGFLEMPNILCSDSGIPENCQIS